MDDIFNLDFELSRVITGATVLVIVVVAWLLTRIASLMTRSGIDRRMRRLTNMPEDDREKTGQPLAGRLRRRPP